VGIARSIAISQRGKRWWKRSITIRRTPADGRLELLARTLHRSVALMDGPIRRLAVTKHGMIDTLVSSFLRTLEFAQMRAELVVVVRMFLDAG